MLPRGYKSRARIGRKVQHRHNGHTTGYVSRSHQSYKVTKEMNQLMRCCRRMLLGTAFVLVMAGTGSLLGAIAGVLLVLLGHVVLGMSAGMLELVPGSVALGTVCTMSLGIFLLARHSLPVVWQPRLVPIGNTETEQAS